MSKERELLEKVLLTFSEDALNQLCCEIRDLLAQPEQENLTPRQGLEEYKKGYAQAELDLKRMPLSNKEIGHAFLQIDAWHRYECFIAGVRFAEKAPGIGGGE